MCRCFPFGRTKGRPEGNCESIVSNKNQNVNKAVDDE